MRRDIDHLLCIFPFEEKFFRENGIRATYVGHPLARLARPSCSREEFFERHNLDPDRPLVALLPGSRAGEARRHWPALREAAGRIAQETQAQLVLALPPGRFLQVEELTNFTERNAPPSIQMIEGQTWDVLARADLALAASGTVTVEAALLGAPMVVFYRVAGLSWLAGRFLVQVPFYSMVNLVAGRAVAPELMQNEMSGARLAAEAVRLLKDAPAREAMRRELAAVAARLATDADPMERAAGIVEDILRDKSPQK
jgi:lipid-A-disaccharide synthase